MIITGLKMKITVLKKRKTSQLRGISLSRCVDPPRSDLRLSLGGCLRFKTFELNFTTPIEDRMMEDLHDLRFTRAHQVCSFEH